MIGKSPALSRSRTALSWRATPWRSTSTASKAALEGLDPDDDHRRLLDSYLTGVVTTQVQREPENDRRAGLGPAATRATTSRTFEQLRLRAPDGHLFPLAPRRQLQTVTGQPEITRDDLKRMVAVTGRISGRDMGSTVRDVKAALDAAGLIPATSTINLADSTPSSRSPSAA